MTELDAVNQILLAAGQPPTSSLEMSGIQEVALARTHLNDVSRTVQNHGWSFNLEKDVTKAVDIDKHIAIDNDILVVIPRNGMDLSVQELGLPDGRTVKLLYDNKNHTFEFNTAVHVDVIHFRSFNILPQYAKDYITIKAARSYQVYTQGSESLYQMTARDEEAVYREFRRMEGKVRKSNIFNDYYSHKIIGR
jgi:hypothetical protein